MTVALAVVVAHLLAGAAHGYAHEGAAVALTTGQAAFVWIVATGGPIVAAVALRRGAIRSGAALLVATMGAATLFDGYYHFVAATPDHVHEVVGPWHDPFLATAVLVSLTDALGVLAGAWLYGSTR